MIQTIKTINDAAKHRMQTCLSCKYFQGSVGRCKVCGCVMQVKVFIPMMRCPKDFWGPVQFSQKAPEEPGTSRR